MRKQKAFVLGLLAPALMMPGLAWGFTARSSDTVTLPKGETHQGSYYAAGQNLTFDGDINGDLFCAGSNVTITGRVRGDVLCAAQMIAVSGHVEGDVRLAAQTVTLTGQIERNASVLAQTLNLVGGKLSGELAVAGQAVSVNAPVGRDMYGAMESLSINAPVTGRLDVATEGLSLGAEGRVGGDVHYTSDRVFKLDEAYVGGKITRHTPPEIKPQPSTPRESLLQWLAGRLYWVLGSLLLGMLMVWVLPRPVRYVTGMMQRRAWPSLGWGALALVSGPLVVFLVALTLVGLPMAMVLAAMWAAALMAAGTMAGIAAGQWMLERGTEMERESLPVAALVGIPVWVFASGLPYVGGVIAAVGAAWFLGAALLSIKRHSR